RVSGRGLREQKIVMLGAGSAAIGVADFLCEAMVADGLTQQEARSRFWLINRDGVLHSQRTDLSEEQRVYAQPVEHFANFPRSSANNNVGLSEVIQQIDATILIGLSTLPGAFSESIVREMARKCPRPIILPLSNPTSKSEAIPEDVLHLTAARVDRAAPSGGRNCLCRCRTGPARRTRSQDDSGSTAQRDHLRSVGSALPLVSLRDAFLFEKSCPFPSRSCRIRCKVLRPFHP